MIIIEKKDNKIKSVNKWIMNKKIIVMKLIMMILKENKLSLIKIICKRKKLGMVIKKNRKIVKKNMIRNFLNINQMLILKNQIKLKC
jgi:hypothetical protein